MTKLAANCITDRYSSSNTVTFNLGKDAIEIGSNYLHSCKMKHSGRIPVLSFDCGFSSFKIIEDYTYLVTEIDISTIDAIKHSLGSRLIRSVFQIEDVEEAINQSIRFYESACSTFDNDENVLLIK